MSETVSCPDCGTDNPAGSTSCSACNFPLAAEAAPAPGPAAAGPAASEPLVIRRMRPIRMRRPQPVDRTSLWLWLLFATFCAGVVIVVAIQGYTRNNAPAAVEGSTPGQQKIADQLRAALERDSTSVEAHIELANLLYDTANWPEAIVHYRAAIRRDSTRVTAMVD